MYVLDSSAIIGGIVLPPDSVVIPPEVVAEVKFRTADMLGYVIKEPSKEYIEIIEKESKKTGDFEVLSRTDMAVLALALQEHAILIADDYAMQNVAKALGLKFETAEMHGITEQRKWKWRCVSCGRYYREYYKECPVCGGKLKRVKDRKSREKR